MSAIPPALAEAFALLQAGDAAGAHEAASRAARTDPASARAQLALGIALRMLGRLPEAAQALDRAADLDPRDYAPPYEGAVVRQMQGDVEGALRGFLQASQRRPQFLPAHLSIGLLRFASGDRGGAEASFAAALAIDPHNALALRTYGRHCVAAGRFDRAAELFSATLRENPGDEELPMFLAQVELLLGHWDAAWRAYAGREPRVHHERLLAASGRAYDPSLPAALAGRVVTLVAEQGLGDVLFFLRWAAPLRERGARLRFAGEPRLHSLLERTGLFEEFASDASPPAEGMHLLLGDLPAALKGADPFPPALAIPVDPERERRWRKVLERAGPRPWIGLTWRAGTPPTAISYALHKAVPVEPLLAALAPSAGTLIALQRLPQRGELERAGAAWGRELHDFAPALDDMEDALAVVALLDRHVGVSNTNMHLAASAGRTADVLVPFPPEWRWRIAGESPWFPGFRVHRQSIGGDWSAALSEQAAIPP